MSTLTTLPAILRKKGGDNPLADIKTDMVSWWTLEESSGNRVDSHGSNDMPPNNTPGNTTGIQGNAIQLTRASSEWLQLADASAADFEPNQDLSLCCWFKLDSLVSFEALYSKTNVATMRAYTESNGNLTVQHGNRTFAYGSSTLSTATWYFLYVQWDDAAGQISTSLDDGTMNTSTSGGSASANPDDWYIGSQNGAGLRWDGAIDEFAFWHRHLTSAEITALHNSGSGVTYPDLP